MASPIPGLVNGASSSSGSALPQPPPSSSAVRSANSTSTPTTILEQLRAFGFSIVPAGTPPTAAAISATSQPREVSIGSVSEVDEAIKSASQLKKGIFLASGISGFAMAFPILKFITALIAGTSLALSPLGLVLLGFGVIFAISSLCYLVDRKNIMAEAGLPSDLWKTLAQSFLVWLASLAVGIVGAKAGPLLMAQL